MLVNSVELSEVSFEPDTSRHLADVVMNMTGPSGGSFDISFPCHTAQPIDCPTTLVMYGLIKHATAQARNLPVFRGATEILELDLETVRISAA